MPQRRFSGTLWQATLGATDIQQGLNSYYKLQLLKHDSLDWWEFRPTHSL